MLRSFAVLAIFSSILASSRHRQTSHRHSLGELESQTEIKNAANMVEFYFKLRGDGEANATQILEHGCFCKQLKHNRMNDKSNKAEERSKHDDICEYNRLCTECSRHEAFDMYAEVDDFSDASCRQPYPYTITLDECGNIVCDDLVNPCQQAKCECDLKTARDLYGVRRQALMKTMCRSGSEREGKNLATCCGNGNLYLEYSSESESCTVEADGFPKIVESGSEVRTEEKRLLTEYHSKEGAVLC